MYIMTYIYNHIPYYSIYSLYYIIYTIHLDRIFISYIVPTLYMLSIYFPILYIILYYTILYYIILYYIKLYYIILYYTILYYILHYSILHYMFGPSTCGSDSFDGQDPLQLAVKTRRFVPSLARALQKAWQFVRFDCCLHIRLGQQQKYNII